MISLAEDAGNNYLIEEALRDRGLAENEQRAEVDMVAAQAAVRNLLIALGENPDREGLLDTPRRVAKSMKELLAGYQENPKFHLDRQFEQPFDGPVILRDIELFSLCEHHMLPFMGKAHVAYLPSNGKVVGLSKLARVVEVYARRLQIQERLTNQIADALVEHLNPRGVAVVIESEHFCMKMRGVNKTTPVMETVALRGVYKSCSDLRKEIMGRMQPASRGC